MKKNLYKNDSFTALFAHFIRAARTTLGKSQAKVSKHSDIARRILIGFERGNRPIFDPIFLAILKGTFRTPEEFVEFLHLSVKNLTWDQFRTELIKISIEFLEKIQKSRRD